MTKLTYSETPKFIDLMKRLKRRFRSLPDDLETAKLAAIELRHIQGIDNNSCEEIQGFGNERCSIFKLKKFACRALKGKGVRSGIRVIYAYHRDETRVVFIEIYYKQDQANEDKKLISDYIKSL